MINLREWALPIYTIMMQMAAGTMLMLWVVYTWMVKRHGRAVADQLSNHLVVIIFLTVATAMVGSHYHLSRPILSIFAVANFGTSWLSREITFTVAFAILVGTLWLLRRYRIGTLTVQLAVGWAAVVMGMITVYSMSHVYLLPTQVAWNSFTTPVMFFAAALMLGGLAVAALLLMNLFLGELHEGKRLALRQQLIQSVLSWLTVVAVVAALVEVGSYAVQINQLAGGNASARASLDLLLGLYRVLFGIRLGLLGLGISVLVGVVVWQRRTRQPPVQLMTPVYFAFLFVLISEVLGRFLFYAIHVRTGI